MGNTFGKFFRITTFGESHGPAIGVVIDGFPAGIEIPFDCIQRELNRRRPGQSVITTQRNEPDILESLSGIFEGKSTGAPLCFIVRNRDAHPQEYDSLKDIFRPGHADYTYAQKYGIRDHRGGGRASARETVARVIGGALARHQLLKQGMKIIGYVLTIGHHTAQTIDYEEIEKNQVRCPDKNIAEKMMRAITEAQQEGDSLGGIVEVVATGVPPGLGEPVFDKLDAELAKTLMSLPAVKGVEIGDGFSVAQMKGSACNDVLTPQGFKTNHCGGIVGGISTGQPIIARAAFKPPSSIAHKQETVDVYGNSTTIQVSGRHDPCVVPRAVPIVEAMVALVLYDAWLANRLVR